MLPLCPLLRNSPPRGERSRKAGSAGSSLADGEMGPLILFREAVEGGKEFRAHGVILHQDFMERGIDRDAGYPWRPAQEFLGGAVVNNAFAASKNHEDRAGKAGPVGARTKLLDAAKRGVDPRIGWPA